MNALILEKLNKQFGSSVLESSEFRGELSVIVPTEKIVDVCRFLKEDPDLRFDMLADLFGLDMYTPVKRFGVVYNLYSLKTHYRVRLKTFIEEDNPHVQTVTGVWSTANWHERETFDMFGIVFDGHPDLRRIYMPDEYEHYPLRKDFPLMGIPGSLYLPKK
jgi:NADH-quinone oxidoreductase subunit C